MKDTLPAVLPVLLAHEGGFADHPADPGGPTNFGVTQAVYDAWRRDQNRPTRPIRLLDKIEAEAIFKRRYWDVVRGDELPAGPDYATFDAAVNSGPVRAAKWLQRAAGAVADGKVGAKTIAAVNAAPDKAALAQAVCRLRLGFVETLKNWRVFGRGWARRIAEVEATSVKLALAAAQRSPSAADAKLDQERSRAEQAGRLNAGGAMATGGAAATIPPLQPDAGGDLLTVVLACVVVAAIAVTAILLWRAHVGRQRAAAYAAVLGQGER